MKIGARGIHPFSAAVFFAVVFVITLLTLNPYLLAISFLSGFMFDINLREKKAIKELCCLSAIAVVIVLFNTLFAHYGVTVLFTLKRGNNITLEAFVCGAVYAVRFVSTMIWLSCFNEVVDEEKFLFLFGRLSPRLALVTSMVLRFLPLVSRYTAETQKACRGIGSDSSVGSIYVRLKNATRIVSIVISRLLEHAVDTANSMMARGYTLKGRTSCRVYPSRIIDALLVSVSGLSALLILSLNDSVAAQYNPIIIIAPFSLRCATVCLGFTVLCFLPLAFDITEKKIWSISN